MANIVLQTNNLTKRYGNITALSNLTLSISSGNVYGLLGPNGSGKTTALSLLMGIVRPDSGTFQWFDPERNEEKKCRIGSLIETPNFYPYLSLDKNLRVVAAIKEVPESDIDRVLAIVKLDTRRNSRFDVLSLGMKQRLALASVLLGDPDVLVLDEPTNGLDPEGIAEVRDIIIYEASRGKTILLASHILAEVEKVCTHVAVLKSGILIANGTVNQLLRSDEIIVVGTEKYNEFYDLIVRARFAKTVDILGKELVISLPDNTTPADLNDFAYKNGFTLTKIEVRKQSLESQFLELVKA